MYMMIMPLRPEFFFGRTEKNSYQQDHHCYLYSQALILNSFSELLHHSQLILQKNSACVAEGAILVSDSDSVRKIIDLNVLRKRSP